jgi:hypothetical protein
MNHSPRYACAAVADSIRFVFVPQTAHVPFMAGLPFRIVTRCGFFCSVFFLHFTQYASVISHPLSRLLR